MEAKKRAFNKQKDYIDFIEELDKVLINLPYPEELSNRNKEPSQSSRH
ncbi:MAG: hypothetical protein QXU98_12605 [Candidatus Parvarchaeota archaeon]